MKRIIIICIVFAIIVFAGKVNAEGIVKEWQNSYESDDWRFIDLFDFTNEMANYLIHPRGFKELDNHYIIILKSGEGNTDQILKITKTGEFVKRISIEKYEYYTSGYLFKDEYILGAQVDEKNKGTITFKKYNYDLEEIESSSKPLDIYYSAIKIFFNDTTITIIKKYGTNLSIYKYNYNFELISAEENKYKVQNNCQAIANEVIIAYFNDYKSVVYDSLKDELIDMSPVAGIDGYHQYIEKYYPGFYGDGKSIGKNFHYQKNNEKYDVYTNSGKYITSDSNKYFYDVYGKLAVANDFQNNSFKIYNKDGEKKLECNNIIITKDGFLTLSKLKDWQDNVISTQITKYKIQYQVNKNESINGEIIVDIGYHDVNEVIDIKVIPEEGFNLKELIIEDIYGNRITHDNSYSFTMPASDVTISASFKESTKEETKNEEIEEEIKTDNPKTGELRIITIIYISILAFSAHFILKKYAKI